MHPVPVVYGMTIAEYAQMINGEKWLKNGIQCTLKIVPLKSYDRKAIYPLPVAPSPNLPNMTAGKPIPKPMFLRGGLTSVWGVVPNGNSKYMALPIWKKQPLPSPLSPMLGIRILNTMEKYAMEKI